MAVSLPALSPDRERNGARTREAILDAAEALFAERGYEATSLNDIGAAASVSRGTPGYFFGSKLELYRAVLARCLEQVRDFHEGHCGEVPAHDAPVSDADRGQIIDVLLLVGHVDREPADAIDVGSSRSYYCRHI